MLAASPSPLGREAGKAGSSDHLVPCAGGGVKVPESHVVDCEDCGGRGKVGEPYGGSEFQPPECDPCESCGGSGKWRIDPAADQSSVIAILKEQLNACHGALNGYVASDEKTALRIESALPHMRQALKIALRLRPAQGELCHATRVAIEELTGAKP